MASSGKSGLKKWLKRVAIGFVVLYLVICIGMYFGQEYLLFHPTVQAADAAWDVSIPDTVGLEKSWEEVNFPSELEGKVNALHFKTDSARGVVLYFHGNGGNAGICARNRNPFLARGYDLLMVDYRGYGKSTGPLSEAGMDADAEAAYLYLQQRYPTQSIVIYGQSMGSGFAVRLAAKHTPKVLLLETPYTSLADVGASQYPWLPVHYLIRYPSLSKDHIGEVNCPISIIHGTGDEVIPYSQSEEMVKAAVKANLYTCPGAGHNGCRRTPEFITMLNSTLGLPK